jgi:hypothetical protein
MRKILTSLTLLALLGVFLFSTAFQIIQGGTVLDANLFAGANDGAKIDAAILALPARGGTVDGRALTGCTAPATITINKNVVLLLPPCPSPSYFNVGGSPGISVTSGSTYSQIRGQGRASSVLSTSSGTANIIQIDPASLAKGVDIMDVGFTSSVARTAGAAIAPLSGFTRVERIAIDRTFNGIHFSDERGAGVFIDVVGSPIFASSGSWQNLIRLGPLTVAGQRIDTITFSKVIGDGENTFSDAQVGIYDGTDAPVFSDSIFAGSTVCSVALNINKISTGDLPKGAKFTNVFFEACTARTTNAVQITSCQNCEFHNSQIFAGLNGVVIAGGTGTKWFGGTVFNHNRHGFSLTGGTNTQITGMRLGNNGRETNATYNDINVAAGVTDFQINDNQFYDVGVVGAGNKPLWNLFIAAGATTRYSISNNSWGAEATSGTVSNGATGNVIDAASKIWFTAAGCDNATAASGFDLPTSASPAKTCFGTSPHRFAALDFDATNVLTATTNIHLAFDVAGAPPVADVKTVWFCSTGTCSTNNFVWTLQTACVADTEGFAAPTYNAVQNFTKAGSATTNARLSDIRTSVTMTNCLAGESLFLRVGRDPPNVGDTQAGTMSLLGLELSVRRTMQ